MDAGSTVGVAGGFRALDCGWRGSWDAVSGVGLWMGPAVSGWMFGGWAFAVLWELPAARLDRVRRTELRSAALWELSEAITTDGAVFSASGHIVG